MRRLLLVVCLGQPCEMLTRPRSLNASCQARDRLLFTYNRRKEKSRISERRQRSLIFCIDTAVATRVHQRTQELGARVERCREHKSDRENFKARAEIERLRIDIRMLTLVPMGEKSSKTPQKRTTDSDDVPPFIQLLVVHHSARWYVTLGNAYSAILISGIPERRAARQG